MPPYGGKRFADQLKEVGRLVAHWIKETCQFEPPVKLRAIAHHLGWHVITRVLPHPEDRGLCSRPLRTIWLEYDMRRTRWRYSLAHELMEAQLGVLMQPHWRERLCQEAAAELLFPRDWWRTEFRRYGVSVFGLAARFEASAEATARRIQESVNGILTIYDDAQVIERSNGKSRENVPRLTQEEREAIEGSYLHGTSRKVHLSEARQEGWASMMTCYSLGRAEVVNRVIAISYNGYPRTGQPRDLDRDLMLPG